MIRAWSQWIQFGDKGSKFFFNMLMQKKSREKINRIWVDNKELVDLEEIKEAFCLFYKGLFSSEDSPKSQEAREKCKTIIPSRITMQDSQALKETISVGEIKNDIRNLNNDKGLGPNGLPIEFYKANEE